MSLSREEKEGESQKEPRFATPVSLGKERDRPHVTDENLRPRGREGMRGLGQLTKKHSC